MDIDELVEELELELLLIFELVELFELVEDWVTREGDDSMGWSCGVSCWVWGAGDATWDSDLDGFKLLLKILVS